MNYLFISPNYPANMENFVDRLANYGHRVLGIGDTPFDQLSRNLQNKLAYYCYQPDLNNYDAMIRHVGLLTHKFGKIDRIESQNEYWMELDAALRTDFNVSGIQKAELPTFKYKSHMKEVFKKARVAIAQGQVVHNLAEALKAVAQLNYPIILKPDNGVGAKNTFKIENQRQLEDAYQQIGETEAYFMEQFIAGEMVSYDGLCDKDGNIVYESSLTYTQPMLDNLLLKNEVIFYRLPNIDEKLRKSAQRAVKKFNIKERFFHMEFFKVNNRYIALELNCRIPGGSIVDMMNFADDIDLYTEYSRIVSDLPFSGHISNYYRIAYCARRAHVEYYYTINQIKEKYPAAIMLSGGLDSAYNKVMGDYFFIIRHHQQEELDNIIKDIVKAK